MQFEIRKLVKYGKTERVRTVPGVVNAKNRQEVAKRFGLSHVVRRTIQGIRMRGYMKSPSEKTVFFIIKSDIIGGERPEITEI